MTQTIVKVDCYEVSHTNGADLTALRHGETWRNLAGDNLILALVDRIAELEEKEKLWLEPSDKMVNAGISELQQKLDEWSEASVFASDPDEITDDMASDAVVFILQAMAGKRNG